MSLPYRAIVACALGATFAAGCSAGPHAALPASPSTSSIKATRGHARLVLRLTIPKHERRRRARYVSPSTKSISIDEGGVLLGTFDTTVTGSGCQSKGGATACEFTMGANPGRNQTFTVTAYDATGGKGSVLSTGSVTQSIATGQQNFLLITLSGVVASVTIGLQNANPPAGTAAALSVIVMAKDADGNTIVGPGNYNASISLTDSDAGGIASLSTTKVDGPGTTVTLSYSGKSLTSATIGATVSGLSPSKITPVTFAPAPTVVADYPLPLSGGSTAIEPSAIATGPDGNLWLGVCCNAQTGIIKMTTAGVMTYYVNGTSPSTNLLTGDIDGLVGGPDGNVWYSQRTGNVGFITPAGSVTNFPLTGGSICAGASGWRIVGSADGGFWVTVGCTGGSTQIAHVTTGGTIAPFNIGGLDFVNGLMLGKDGNVYAAGEMHSNSHAALAQAIVSGSSITSSSLLDVSVSGTNTNLNGVFQTPDGDFWVTNNSCSPSVLTRIHPSGAFSASTMTAYNSLAGCAQLAYGVTLPDGTMWIADGNYPIVTRVTPGAYPAAPSLWDLAAPSTVQGFEWDAAIGPDGDLYVVDWDDAAGVSGDVLKVAY